MKKSILALLVAGLVAGCGQGASDPDTGAADAALGVGADQASEPAVTTESPDISFPEGIELDFPHIMRGERVVTHDDGREVRRVSLEYLEGDQQSIFASIAESLSDAGFSEREVDDRPGGNIRARYGKGKFGPVIVLVFPEEQDGGGQVRLDFPL